MVTFSNSGSGPPRRVVDIRHLLTFHGPKMENMVEGLARETKAEGDASMAEKKWADAEASYSEALEDMAEQVGYYSLLTSFLFVRDFPHCMFILKKIYALSLIAQSYLWYTHARNGKVLARRRTLHIQTYKYYHHLLSLFLSLSLLSHARIFHWHNKLMIILILVHNLFVIESHGFSHPRWLCLRLLLHCPFRCHGR